MHMGKSWSRTPSENRAACFGTSAASALEASSRRDLRKDRKSYFRASHKKQQPRPVADLPFPFSALPNTSH
jgi:hypothetical protein